MTTAPTTAPDDTKPGSLLSLVLTKGSTELDQIKTDTQEEALAAFARVMELVERRELPIGMLVQLTQALRAIEQAGTTGQLADFAVPAGSNGGALPTGGTQPPVTQAPPVAMTRGEMIKAIAGGNPGIENAITKLVNGQTQVLPDGTPEETSSLRTAVRKAEDERDKAKSHVARLTRAIDMVLGAVGGGITYSDGDDPQVVADKVQRRIHGIAGVDKDAVRKALDEIDTIMRDKVRAVAGGFMTIKGDDRNQVGTLVREIRNEVKP